ncbi:MAG: CBS domain-containing protein [Bdellovibrionaceae bacterium]|nr:CBS domain-containing protein [Pseudobdellovibrionaceae bacterium]
MKNSSIVFNENITFHQIIEAVENCGNGFIAVVDNENKLLGLVTDGDIRRSLLKEQINLENLINKNPSTFLIGQSEKSAFAFMQRNHIRHLPIVDKDRKLIKVLTLGETEFVIRDNPVFIAAGGIGKRLNSLTKDTPKPMLKIGEKPILEHLLDNFIKHGFVNFYISVNYLSEQIINYFGDGTSLGINIKYIKENKRMGTVGSLYSLKNDIKTHFFVVNADILTSLNFADMLHYHIEKNEKATMCVREYKVSLPYGVVDINPDGHLQKVLEKPIYEFYINSGIYILSPCTLSKLPEDTFFDMPDLIKLIINDKEAVASYLFNGYWTDIGHISNYNEAVSYYRQGGST